MIRHWLTIFDVPAVICSDRGNQFVRTWFKTMCKHMGIRHAKTVAYHSRSNGRAEVAWRQMFEKFRQLHIDEPGWNWYISLCRVLQPSSPHLGGTLVCAAQHLKRYYDPEDLCGEEWALNDEEIAALDLQGAASPMEVEGELPDMNAEAMAKEGFYLVKSVLRHRYRQDWRLITL